jgi:hypothetical protein
MEANEIAQRQRYFRDSAAAEMELFLEGIVTSV